MEALGKLFRREKIRKVGKYDIGKAIGEGTFGKHGVNRETGERVAIKIIDRAKAVKRGAEARVLKEINILRKLKHPNVVNIKEVMTSPNKMYIVLELVTGGELFYRIAKTGRIPEDTARSYFLQLIAGLDHCHTRGICHRDIKPENLLLDELDVLKISDFGLATYHVENDAKVILKTKCGTYNYLAPEVLDGRGYDGVMADVWSCGVVLYVLLAGFLPFEDQSQEEVIRKVKKAEVKYPPWLSAEARRLIASVLTLDPSRRATLAQVKESDWARGVTRSGAGTPPLRRGLTDSRVLDQARFLLQSDSEIEERSPSPSSSFDSGRPPTKSVSTENIPSSGRRYSVATPIGSPGKAATLSRLSSSGEHGRRHSVMSTWGTNSPPGSRPSSPMKMFPPGFDGERRRSSGSSVSSVGSMSVHSVEDLGFNDDDEFWEEEEEVFSEALTLGMLLTPQPKPQPLNEEVERNHTKFPATGQCDTILASLSDILLSLDLPHSVKADSYKITVTKQQTEETAAELSFTIQMFTGAGPGNYVVNFLKRFGDSMEFFSHFRRIQDRYLKSLRDYQTISALSEEFVEDLDSISLHPQDRRPSSAYSAPRNNSSDSNSPGSSGPSSPQTLSFWSNRNRRASEPVLTIPPGLHPPGSRT